MCKLFWSDRWRYPSQWPISQLWFSAIDLVTTACQKFNYEINSAPSLVRFQHKKEQMTPNLGVFRSRVRTPFWASWDDRACAITCAQLFKSFYAFVHVAFEKSLSTIVKYYQTKSLVRATSRDLPMSFLEIENCVDR